MDRSRTFSVYFRAIAIRSERTYPARRCGGTDDPGTAESGGDRLEGAGLGLQDIVKTTVWLRREADFAAFNDSYARFFGQIRPARSTVISALVHPAALVEIEAIASRREPVVSE
jgi:2-iminobutanoate/2-iminopropanoate deaminase